MHIDSWLPYHIIHIIDDLTRKHYLHVLSTPILDCQCEVELVLIHGNVGVDD